MTGISAEVLRLSNLEMNELVRPKLAGAQILFCTDHYGYTHVREFSFSEAATRARSLNLGGSNDITINLPRYMNGLVKNWDVGEAVDTACFIDPINPKRVYVYKYLWAGAAQQIQKLQSAWSTWEFNYDVRWVRFMDNVLNMVVTTDEGTFFCSLKPQEGQGLEADAPPLVHLDRRLDRPYQQFTPSTGRVGLQQRFQRHHIHLAIHSVEEVLAIVKYENSDYKGLLLGKTSSKTLVCTKGDWTNAQVAFGERYEFRYEFGQAYMPDANKAMNRVIGQLHGRTQVLRWQIDYVNSGQFTVRVNRKDRGRTAGSISTFEQDS